MGKPSGSRLYPGSTNLAPGVLNFTYSITRLGACFLVKKDQMAPGPCFHKSRLVHDRAYSNKYTLKSSSDLVTNCNTSQ